MSKITFLATGLGVLHPDYEKNKEMKMRFLMNTKHQLRIKTVRSGNGTGTGDRSERTYYLGDYPVKINVVLDSDVKPIPPLASKKLSDHIVNLNDLHFPGASKKLKDKSANPLPFSDLTIEKGKTLLYSAVPTKKYEIWKKVTVGAKVTQELIDTDEFTLKIGADFNIPNGKSVQVNITGDEGFNLKFPHKVNVNYTVEFNNDCDNCQRDDYYLFYKVLDGKDGNKMVEIREDLIGGSSISDIIACNPPVGGGGS